MGVMIDIVTGYYIIGCLLSCYWEIEEAISSSCGRRICPREEMTLAFCFFGFVIPALLWPLFVVIWVHDKYVE